MEWSCICLGFFLSTYSGNICLNVDSMIKPFEGFCLAFTISRCCYVMTLLAYSRYLIMYNVQNYSISWLLIFIRAQDGFVLEFWWCKNKLIAFYLLWNRFCMQYRSFYATNTTILYLILSLCNLIFEKFK